MFKDNHKILNKKGEIISIINHSFQFYIKSSLRYVLLSAIQSIEYFTLSLIIGNVLLTHISTQLGMLIDGCTTQQEM
jgi:hypothetical protein